MQGEVSDILFKLPLKELVRVSGMSPSALKEIRAGCARPHRKHRELLTRIAQKFANKNAQPKEENTNYAVQKSGR
jgi:uncharacterized radical SAM superfamily protein